MSTDKPPPPSDDKPVIVPFFESDAPVVAAIAACQNCGTTQRAVDQRWSRDQRYRAALCAPCWDVVER